MTANWYQYNCPGCLIDPNTVRKIPKKGLIVEHKVYSAIPVDFCPFGHALNEKQLSLF